MKLKRLTVRHFRCYHMETVVEFDDLTTLIGMNDAGKSSLLDALDTFFNDTALDKHDASKQANAAERRQVEIACSFLDLPELLVLDDKVETSLRSEFLLNVGGELEIVKTYNCGKEKPSIVGVFLRAIHPTSESVKDLMLLKIEQLKKRANDLGVDLSAVDQKVKKAIRQAIREHVGDLALGPISIPLVLEGPEKSNGDEVWSRIKTELPTYSLFKSDRQSSDQDAEAQEPLKTAIKEAISACLPQLNEVMGFVEREVKKVADLTLAKLNEMDSSVARSLSPQFERADWAKLFKASITGDDDIPLNNRGSGVRRLVLLNFLRAKAELAQRERVGHTAIYAIEEPETSQHPHNQRLLMRALMSLAGGKDQVIVTTHTPVLARSLPATSIRFLRKSLGQPEILNGGADAINEEIAKSLGILPDHDVKIFIMVEGIHDVAFFKNLSVVLHASDPSLPDLDTLELAGHVVFVPAGGAANLAHWVNRVRALNRPEFHIYDRDAASDQPTKHQPKIDEVNAQVNCKAVSTSVREIENYVHYQAINAAAAAKGYALALQTNYAGDHDVPAALTLALNAIAPTHDRWGPNRVKSWLAQEAVPLMTAQMLLEVDPLHQCVGWLRDITTLMQPQVARP